MGRTSLTLLVLALCSMVVSDNQTTPVDATTTTLAMAAAATTTQVTQSTPTTQKSVAEKGGCQVPVLESKIRFSLRSVRNGTGPWISTVSGERRTPTAVSAGDDCPWSVRVGHEVTSCPLDNRGVRLVATVETDSNVTDGDVAALVKSQEEVPPPVSEYKLTFRNSEYKLDLRLVKWELAQRYCREESADLVVINSQEEADVLKKMLAEQGMISEDPYENKQVWVGLHDRSQEGNFVTVYGEPIAETGYVVWSIGEPNNLDRGEDCVSLLRNGAYNDEICAKKLAFICERTRYRRFYF